MKEKTCDVVKSTMSNYVHICENIIIATCIATGFFHPGSGNSSMILNMNIESKTVQAPLQRRAHTYCMTMAEKVTRIKSILPS